MFNVNFQGEKISISLQNFVYIKFNTNYTIQCVYDIKLNFDWLIALISVILIRNIFEITVCILCKLIRKYCHHLQIAATCCSCGP